MAVLLNIVYLVFFVLILETITYNKYSTCLLHTSFNVNTVTDKQYILSCVYTIEYTVYSELKGFQFFSLTKHLKFYTIFKEHNRLIKQYIFCIHLKLFDLLKITYITVNSQ